MGEIRIKRDVSDAIVYGFHIDPSISDPSNAVTYIEDAVGMTPASMGSTSFNAGSWADAFFIPKPCMVRYDGTVDYYLDPSDYSKKADGTASDVADSNYAGNAMMEWGLIWYKFDTENLEEGEVNFYVSNKQVDDSYHCWCNYDADGNIIPHFYTAIYNGTGTDKLRSISGVQLTPENGSGNTTGQQEITRATANNTTTKTEWYTDILADRELINMLLVLIGKSLNAQAVFGRGIDTGNQAAKEAYVTGTLDDKGLFWGVTTNGDNAVKVFGMENYWGCVWHRVAGMVSVHNATTNSNTIKIKLTHSTVDGTDVSSFNDTGNGYIDTGVKVAATTGLYVRKMKYFDKGYLPLLTTGGSSSTYYSDYTYLNYTSTFYLLTGGHSGAGLLAGPFYFILNSGFSGSAWNIAAAPSLKPRAKTPYNPDWDNRPAHKFTNGEWIDIPTHKYTNGRWQGELTSQSPLKFRADGEMLDWRIEGKTSQNLFDIGKNVNDYERAYSIISVDGSSISMKYEASGMTYHYRTHNITTTGTVTIYCKGLKAKPQLLVRLRSMDDTKWLTNSDVTISGMAYNNVYNGWYGYAGSDTFIKTIIIPECLYWNMGVGFNSGGTAGEAVTISNPMVISGAYTSETIPPYEPYGGVGDYDETTQRYKIPVTVNGVTTNIYTDRQLMDGDSIDYATDQTQIPIATGNNTLSVDTAVQPKSVFVKFEG